MALYDMPIEQLRTYLPPLTRADDFDAFWQDTLAQAAKSPLDASFTPYEYPLRNAAIYAVRYTGWGGARIAGWYVCPAGPGPFPGVVIYHGYGGSKPAPHLLFPWVLQGFAVLAVDTRGQPGESTDPAVYSTGHRPGWMTAGVLDPQEYYYRGAFVDCVRALDALATRPEVDMTRVALTGISQGGGLTLAVAALDHRPALAMPDVPYLCHYERAVDMAARHPYIEISDYIKMYPERERQVYHTLSYFDNMNLAPWIRCPVLVSVGLVDDICPPSTIFATYNRIEASKEIVTYRYHNHEDIIPHWPHKMAWALKYLTQ